VTRDWESVPLSQLLTRTTESIALEPSEKYREVTIKLWGKGVQLRREVAGAGIAADRRTVVRPGQFILSKIDARNGAFGLVPESLDGAVVTNDFPAFNVNKDRLEPAFLGWLSRTSSFVDWCRAASEGTTNRVRLNESRFLGTPILIPPLEEQRRIVARVEAMVSRVEEAQKLRDGAIQYGERLLISMAHRDDLTEQQKLEQGWSMVAIKDVLALAQDRHIVQPDKKYPNLGIYSFGKGLFSKPPIDGATTSALSLYRVAKGQFIYSRLFAFEGAYGIVNDEFDNRYVSNEYPTFDCDLTRATPEFFLAYLKSPKMWAAVAMGSKGLGDRRKRIQPEQFLDFRLMLPPLEWHKKITAFSKTLHKLRIQQESSRLELDMLLPSILAKAFAGEL
jgi:type I restriction enzyme, S subunit